MRTPRRDADLRWRLASSRAIGLLINSGLEQRERLMDQLKLGETVVSVPLEMVPTRLRSCKSVMARTPAKHVYLLFPTPPRLDDVYVDGRQATREEQLDVLIGAAREAAANQQFHLKAVCFGLVQADSQHHWIPQHLGLKGIEVISRAKFHSELQELGLTVRRSEEPREVGNQGAVPSVSFFPFSGSSESRSA